MEAKQAPPIAKAQDPSRGPEPPDVEASIELSFLGGTWVAGDAGALSSHSASNQDGDSKTVVRTSGEDDPLDPRNGP
ncbi:hypothetical protein DL768_009952 [Monosporascus sp. mg162]|nr:hypothetical protein DL768_009952 [Monosporascus sp. mg162]